MGEKGKPPSSGVPLLPLTPSSGDDPLPLPPELDIDIERLPLVVLLVPEVPSIDPLADADLRVPPEVPKPAPVPSGEPVDVDELAPPTQPSADASSRVTELQPRWPRMVTFESCKRQLPRIARRQDASGEDRIGAGVEREACSTSGPGWA